RASVRGLDEEARHATVRQGKNMETSDKGDAVGSRAARKHHTDLPHLSAAVSHHIINAFGAIVSNAELLRLKPQVETDGSAGLADTIVQTALDASSLARRFIDFTRSFTSVEPKRSASATDTLTLDDLASEVITTSKASYNRPGIEWITQLEPTPALRGHA